jgi:hypothetical protein
VAILAAFGDTAKLALGGIGVVAFYDIDQRAGLLLKFLGGFVEFIRIL